MSTPIRKSLKLTKEFHNINVSAQEILFCPFWLAYAEGHCSWAKQENMGHTRNIIFRANADMSLHHHLHQFSHTLTSAQILHAPFKASEQSRAMGRSGVFVSFSTPPAAISRAPDKPG